MSAKHTILQIGDIYRVHNLTRQNVLTMRKHENHIELRKRTSDERSQTIYGITYLCNRQTLFIVHTLNCIETLMIRIICHFEFDQSTQSYLQSRSQMHWISIVSSFIFHAIYCMIFKKTTEKFYICLIWGTNVFSWHSLSFWELINVIELSRICCLDVQNTCNS